MRFSSSLVALLPALLVAACSSGASHSSGGNGSGSGSGSGSSGSGSSSGSSSSSGGGSCPSPYLLALTKLGQNGGTIQTITSDGTTLYLGAQTGLFSMPVAGGSLTSLFGQVGVSNTSSGVADFWFSGANALFINDESYVSVPKAGGGSPTTLASLPDADGVAMTDGTNVYFVTDPSGSGADGGFTTTYSLNAIPVAGGAVKPVVTFDAQPDDLILAGGSFYWIDAGSSLFGSGPIYTLPVGGGTPTNTNIQAMAGQLAADGTYLYFSSVGEAAPGPAMRVALADLTGTPTQVSNLGGQWLAVQGSDLYGCVVDAGGYEAWKAPLTGGTATVIACAPTGTTAQGFGVDGTSVYMSVTNSSEESGLIAVPR